MAQVDFPREFLPISFRMQRVISTGTDALIWLAISRHGQVRLYQREQQWPSLKQQTRLFKG
jgi:hypothetical protein